LFFFLIIIITLSVPVYADAIYVLVNDKQINHI
jgi:hypothetical protein